MIINAVAPVGNYNIDSEPIILSDVIATAITTGKIITNGKETISGISFQNSGIVKLKQIILTQNDTSASADLELIAMDLYIYKNSDALSLASGASFALDSANAITDISPINIAATDWQSPDANNAMVLKTDLNIYINIEDTLSKDLSFVLVARGSATFSNHVLTADFCFEQAVNQ